MAHKCADQHIGWLILIRPEGSVTAGAAAGLVSLLNITVSTQPIYVKVVLMHEIPKQMRWSCLWQ